MDVYKHILYLDIPAERIAQNRAADTQRIRSSSSVAHLEKWQRSEQDQLRQLCRSYGIPFMRLTPRLASAQKISVLLRDFLCDTAYDNIQRAVGGVDQIIAACSDKPDNVLVIDGDKTLAAEDSGPLFWERVFPSWRSFCHTSPLKELFGGPAHYSDSAFRQAMLLCDEAVDDKEFERTCAEVASTMTMHIDFVSPLHLIANSKNARAVVVTCGIRRIWDMILERERLTDTVEVIGGGRLVDGFVVTPVVKAAVVNRLRSFHRARVWGFGDSPLDLEMLQMADEAIVVTGNKDTRSRSMDMRLRDALDNQRFRPRQALLPHDAPPRLDTDRLPLVDITAPDFVATILGQQKTGSCSGHSCHGASSSQTAINTNEEKKPPRPDTTKDLSRRRMVSQHRAARRSHRAQNLPIPHVQDYSTDGFRLFHEKGTLTVDVMRSGEPLALGKNECFPQAMFLHAKNPEDITSAHLRGRFTLFLVDAVVNSGKTVLEFIHHIRGLHATVQIAVVAGVAQDQAVVADSNLMQELTRYPRLGIVALRVSANKYTGRGTTDTGNRLFNTVHLP